MSSSYTSILKEVEFLFLLSVSSPFLHGGQDKEQQIRELLSLNSFEKLMAPTWSHFSAGLQELFTSPNLQKITEEPLFVSSVQHQATLELKEDGVEASAATSVMLSRSVSVFSLDRPFFFIIFEDETGIPLFIGSVQNPSPDATPQIREPQDSSEATDTNKRRVPK